MHSEAVGWATHILDNITDGLVTLDSEWRYTYVNAGAERLLSRPRSELLGKSLWGEFPAVLGTDVERDLRRATAERVACEFEGYNAAWDRWYDNRAFPMPGGGVAVHFRDITARKRAEVQRNRSEALFAEAQQVAHVGSWNWDLEGDTVTWSDEHYRIFGLLPQEMVMTYDRFLSLVHPDDRGVVQGVIEKVLRDRQPFDYSLRTLHQDGTGRVVQSRGQAVFNEAGKPVRMFGTVQDITERKAADEALRRQKEILQIVFDHIPVMINFIDSASRAQLVNRHWEQVLGWSQEEAQARELVPEFYPDPQERERVLEVVRNPPPGWTDFKTRVRDGRVLDTSWALVVLSDGTRIGFGLDTTERKGAEEALRRSEERLAADLAGMTRLQEVSTRLVRAGDTTSLLLEIVDAAIAVTAADMGNIQLLDSAAGTLKIVASRGFEEPFLTFFKVAPRGQAACGTAMDRGERVVVGNVTTSPVFLGTPELDVLLAAGVRAAQCTPLICRSGRLVGALSTHYRSAHLPADRDLRVLDMLARQAADWIERLHAEDALRASEEKYRRLVDLLPLAVSTYDADGFLTFYNDHARDIWGWSPEVGDPLHRYSGSYRLFWPDGTPLPQDRTLTAEALRNGTTSRNREEIVEQPGGQRIHMFVNIDPIRDAAGKIVGAINVFSDVTVLKQAEEALRQSRDEMEARVRERTDDLARANAALAAEVRERGRAEEARTELLRRLATVEEDERRRISRELHDQVGQQLTFLALGLKAVRDSTDAPDRGLLERLQKTAEEVGRELHDLALRLRPTALDDLGLRAALQSAVEEWSRRAGVEADFHSSGLEGERLPGEVETVLYRVALEALHNVLKHAHATRFNVILERRDHHAVAIVEDDGAGFDAEAALSRPDGGRLGLAGMRERLALVGGTLEVESTPGTGTTVFARAPLPAGEEGSPP